MTEPAGGRTAPDQLRRVVVSSVAGNIIEQYDFLLYGFIATLAFGPLFFPTFSPVAATLASLSTFAVGFVARPLGSIVCGHYGDQIERKSMLVMTLSVAGGSTFLMGLLPIYESIGIWAPALLVALRFLQGFSFGGEYGGAVLMVAEYAPAARRGSSSVTRNVRMVGQPLGASGSAPGSGRRMPTPLGKPSSLSPSGAAQYPRAAEPSPRIRSLF